MPSSLTKILPIALLALIAGFAIGYFTGQGVVAVEERGSATSTTADQTSDSAKVSTGSKPTSDGPSHQRQVSDASSMASRTDDHAATSPSPRPDAPSSTGSLRDRIVAAIADLPPITPAAGVGEIRGTITDSASGAPIAGIFVEAKGSPEWAGPAKRSRPTGPAMPTPEPDVAELAERAIRFARTDRERFFVAKTDSNGVYVFSVLPELNYHIKPLSHDYAFSVVKSSRGFSDPSRSATIGSTIDFTATRSWMIELEFVSPEGSPVANCPYEFAHLAAAKDRATAEQLAQSASFNSATTWTGPGDYISVSSGYHVVRAKPESGRSSRVTGTLGVSAESVDSSVPQLKSFYASDTVVLFAGEGGDSKVTINLRQVPTILATLVDESGEAQSHSYHLQCMPWDGTQPPTPQELRTHQPSKESMSPAYRQHYWYETANAFSIAGVLTGRHAVVVRTNNRILAHTFVEVGQRTVEAKLVIPPPARASYAVVWVRDPSGGLISRDVRFSVVLSSRQGSTSGGHGNTPMPDGSWRMPHYAMDDARATHDDANWTVTVHHTSYGSLTQSYRPGPASELSFQFLDPASIEVTVDGLANHAANGSIKVRFEAVLEGDTSVRTSSLTQSQTTRAFYGSELAQPGNVRISMMVSVVGYDDLLLEAREVSLVSGANAIRLSLPALYSVTITLPESKAGGQIYVQRVDESSSRNEPRRRQGSESFSKDLDGKLSATFPFLPAGQYRISASSSTGGRYDQTTFRLPGETAITMYPRR